MKEYTVTVNFAGFIGCDQEYTVYADSREEAEELALQEATDDLSVEVIDEEDEGTELDLAREAAFDEVMG